MLNPWPVLVIKSKLTMFPLPNKNLLGLNMFLVLNKKKTIKTEISIFHFAITKFFNRYQEGSLTVVMSCQSLFLKEHVLILVSMIFTMEK